MKLLTIGNPKTAKGEARNYLTGILHLAPFNLSGVNVCPMAEIAGCVSACLNTAGRGGIAKGGLVTQASAKDGSRTNVIQLARIRRTKLYLEHRDEFMALLVKDVQALVHKAASLGLKPAVRLNGTSDIRWEDIPLTSAMPVLGFNPGWTTDVKYPSIFARFPSVQFYDYTKIPNRRRALDVPNYHLTFSYSARPEFQPYVDRALQVYGDKANVAVVFAKPSNLKNVTAPYPVTFLGRPIVNGDDHDLRFLDPKGVVVALTAKGQAKKDTSGFVVVL